MTPVWSRYLKVLLTRGRPPNARRVRIWRARAAFDRAARALRPGDVAIDCGANVGRYTEILARSGCIVHAFEPDPVAFAELFVRFADRSNVTLHQAAVGVAEGEATLYRVKDFDADPLARTVSSSLVAAKDNADVAAGLAVRQIDLLRFIDALPSVAILKLDIEGAEAALLERLLETGRLARIGAVFVETHEGKIADLEERIEALRASVSAAGLSGSVNLDWA